MRLIPTFIVLLIFFTCSLAESWSACGINWSLPQNHFENVNPQGKLSWWKDLGQVDAGDGLMLPLHLNFRADRHMQSPTLGTSGFLFGLGDATAVALDENRFLMHTPAGRYLLFRRDRKDPNILTSGKKWVGEIKEDVITIATSCGDRLTYRRGQLTRMALKERVFDYVYHNGQLSEIKEKGRTVITFKREDDHLLVQSRDGKQVRFNFGERPVVQHIAGQNVIGKLGKTLASVVTTSGEEVKFAFGVTSDIKPTLEVEESLLTWNAANGEVLQDGEWMYEIKPGEKPFHNAAIGRENAKKELEFWHKDTVKGEEISRNINGFETFVTKFASGHLAGKIRKKEITKNGKKIEEEKRSYTELGEIIRISKSDGTFIIFNTSK